MPDIGSQEIISTTWHDAGSCYKSTTSLDILENAEPFQDQDGPAIPVKMECLQQYEGPTARVPALQVSEPLSKHALLCQFGDMSFRSLRIA